MSMSHIHISDYLDAAHEQTGTWNELSALLKVNRRTISFWNQGKGYPGEKNMIHLARIIGRDETVALLHLASWKSKGKARKLYRKLISEHLGDWEV